MSSSVRPEIARLGELGPFPSSVVADAETVGTFADLLLSIKPPVTDEEARMLVGLFGPDDLFGMAYTVIHLVETAPGWPLEDCLKGENQFIGDLRRRIENSERYCRQNPPRFKLGECVRVKGKLSQTGTIMTERNLARRYKVKEAGGTEVVLREDDLELCDHPIKQ